VSEGAADRDEPRVVVRDKRRIDPVSGAVRDAGGGAGATAASAPPSSDSTARTGLEAEFAADARAAAQVDADLDALRTQLVERTADVQRIKAEYDNYRRRVDRDRAVAGEQATARVFAGLLPALDDIGRAREHGDLDGPFRAVAEQLEATLVTLGLTRYGEPGDVFDPAVHEAMMHAYRNDVGGPTCVQVFRPGYLFAGKVLRPAQVAVAEPEEAPGPPPPPPSEQGTAAAAAGPHGSAGSRPTPGPAGA
jgi:molecular chaperone GrpE